MPARDWGVATISPSYGFLSGTRANPNLQPEQEERVWIWRFADNDRSLVTRTSSGNRMKADFKPFSGTVGVAPAHGEIKLSVTPGDFGGNLDLPCLGPGTTVYLPCNVDEGHLYLGDGHYVEGAFNSTLVAGRLPPDPGFDWPRIETALLIGVVGCARPLEDAVRIAASGLVHWIAELTGYDTADSHEFVSQTCPAQDRESREPGILGVLFGRKGSHPGQVAGHGRHASPSFGGSETWRSGCGDEGTIHALTKLH